MNEKSCYFLDNDGNYHELSPHTPARKGDGTMTTLDKVPYDGEYIEVFLGNMWCKGIVQPQPKVMEFKVSVVTFDDENKVWREMEAALRHSSHKKFTSMPWVKITPPSRA